MYHSLATKQGVDGLGLSIIILAAGQGTRMRSDLPKVLQPLAGKPVLAHVLAVSAEAGANDVCVVYGHGGDAVQAAFAESPIRWALQAEQLGTGHAVQQAMPETPDENRVLILAGDVPLLTLNTLERLIAETPEDAMAVLTVDMDDPAGYGRIVRGERQRAAHRGAKRCKRRRGRDSRNQHGRDSVPGRQAERVAR